MSTAYAERVSAPSPVPTAQPMLAASGDLPRGPGWAYELKWDGVRAVARIHGAARLFARSGAEVTLAYPELAGLVAAVDEVVLDGEVVVMGPDGRPSFTALAERMHVRDPGKAAQLAQTLPVTYMIFDLLGVGPEDLRGLPYRVRRERLEAIGELARDEGGRWLVPPRFSDGPGTLQAAVDLGLEGVVAKRLDSPYRSGQRGPEWIKVKNDLTGDFVVGGWRPGVRQLGALLVGIPRPDGLLDFRGRVGGGISNASEQNLLSLLRPLAVVKSPFAVPLTREDAKAATFVRPELVVEVRYGQLTPERRLRFPRFVRLRQDKSPGEANDG